MPDGPFKGGVDNGGVGEGRGEADALGAGRLRAVVFLAGVPFVRLAIFRLRCQMSMAETLREV